MEVFHLNHSDIDGGAARAAYRIHLGLRASGVRSTMLVNMTSSGDWTIRGPQTFSDRLAVRLRPAVSAFFNSLLHTENAVIHSPAFLRSNWVKQLNHSDADVIHLHWIGREMISIADIGRIEKPIVWTLHDMWAFCGAEHYTEDARWLDGYRRDNRPAYEAGFDLNRWTWLRKLKQWQSPMSIVAPSRWMACQARKSRLMQDWPIRVVPNCLDTDSWQGLEPALARQLLGLPVGVPLVLFGAMGGGRDPRKGFDLLARALKHLRGRIADLEVVVFGQHAPRDPLDLGFPVHYVGQLHDDLSLRAVYSAADLLVVPSRQDNLPNTGVEAQACGTPVIAFDTGGLPDVVEHHRTGYLAEPFDTEDLARGIAWVLTNPQPDRIRQQARDRAVGRFSYPVVAQKYLAVYHDAVAMQGRLP